MTGLPSFSSLVQIMDPKDVKAEGLTQAWVGQDGKTAATRPLVSFQAWTCYGVRQNTDADLEVEFTFSDAIRFSAGESSDYKVRFRSRARIGADINAALMAAGRSATRAGQTSVLVQLARATLEDWARSDAGPKDGRLLTGLVQHNAGAVQAIIGAFESVGVELSDAALLMVPWHDGRVDLDEPGGLVFKTDSTSVTVNLLGLLDRDDKRPVEFFTSSIPRFSVAGTRGIKDLAIDALKRALDGNFTRQQWVAETELIQSRARDVVNLEVARYGRKVVQLVLQTDVAAAQIQPINFDLTPTYRITGVNRDLKIQHRGSLKLVDAGRWEQAKRNDPRAIDMRNLVATMIQEETERQLQGMRYNEAVRLLADSDDPVGGTGQGPIAEQKLRADIQAKLREPFARYGFEATQFTTVVQDLPERMLLRGIDIEMAPESHELSVPGRTAKLGFRGHIKLVNAERIVPFIISGDGDALVERIKADALKEIAAYVSAISPDDYLKSNLADSKNLWEGGAATGPSEAALLTRIREMMGARFGVEFSDGAVRRGADPITERVYELQRTPFEVVIRGEPVSHKTTKREWVDVFVSGQIQGPSGNPGMVSIFNAKAARPKEEQLGELRACIEGTLRRLMTLVPFEFFLPIHFNAKVAPGLRAIIEAVVEEEQGIAIKIDAHGLYTNPLNDVERSPGLIEKARQLEEMEVRSAKALERMKDVDDFKSAKEEYEKYKEAIEYFRGQIEEEKLAASKARIDGDAITQHIVTDQLNVVALQMVQTPGLLKVVNSAIHGQALADAAQLIEGSRVAGKKAD